MGNLLDDDLDEDQEPGHDRRAKPGETIHREGTNWVKTYNQLLPEETKEESRRIRSRFESKFTEFPYSWWEDANTMDRERRRLDSVVRDDVASDTYKDTWSVRDNSPNPALSQFPAKLCKQILMMWSKPQDQIWDPFAGHMTRPILSNHFDRDYWGQDISTEFFHRTKEEILSRTEGGLLNDEVIADKDDLVEVDLNNNHLKLQRKDSVESDDVPSESADFTVTSPPYHDLENYGDEPEQLGVKNEDEYEDFMEDLKEVLRHNYRILKFNRYATWVVNDFRKHSMWNGLTPYHVDLINAAREVGFEVHDINLYPTGQSAGIFAQQLIHMECTAKIHEYVITFRKRESGTRWKPRGVHWDAYSKEKIIDEYSESEFERWLADRKDRGLDTERWEDDN